MIINTVHIYILNNCKYKSQKLQKKNSKKNLECNNVQCVPKNDPTCFCQNFVKSQPNLIIFGKQITKMIELHKAHSVSTSRNMLTHYRVKHRCSKLLHYAVIISIRLLTCALSIPQRTPWDLITLWY